MIEYDFDKVSYEFFGESLLDTYPVSKRDCSVELKLPNQFRFNSSWRINHNCHKCGRLVSWVNDFERQWTSFKVTKQITSKHYSQKVLSGVCGHFRSLQLTELSGVTYIHRTDFEYVSIIQKMTSIDLKVQKCSNCDELFLGFLLIGLPRFPDNSAPKGNMGTVSIKQIIGVNKDWEGLQELDVYSHP